MERLCNEKIHNLMIKAADGRYVSADLERHADGILIRLATLGMEEKLGQARESGRGGWWNGEVCSIEFLRELLTDHIEKGDMRDVMNLAAMIYVREQSMKGENDG